MSREPLYRIVYANGIVGVLRPWPELLSTVQRSCRYYRDGIMARPLRVERA